VKKSAWLNEAGFAGDKQGREQLSHPKVIQLWEDKAAGSNW
jgi:hypothetical protein